MANPLATPEQVAEWLQVTTERLSKLRKTQRGPRYVKVGRSVRYAWGDVHAWCTANAITTTTKEAPGATLAARKTL